jgi:hypothetical protein
MLSLIFAAGSSVLMGCGGFNEPPCPVLESRRATCEAGYVLVLDQAMQPKCAKAPLKDVNWR